MSDTASRNPEVESLEKLIQYHNYCYWKLDAPEITDEAFDLLVRRLERLAPNSPVLVRIGEGAAGESGQTLGQKVVHTVPMLSLDKCYTDLEYLAWVTRVWGEGTRGEVAVTPKIDGVAAMLRYGVSGELELAATRGDGSVGEDFTDNARVIRGIPLKIPSGPMEVRGEVHMKRSVFQEKYSAQFANPRNLTAGSLKQKEGNRKQLLDLDFFAYELIAGEQRLDERTKGLRLEAMGFVAPPIWFVEATEVPARYLAALEQRDSWDFEADGIVIKAVDAALHDQLGSTAHHPKWAIAYKFQGDAGITTLEGVEWSVSRTGSITPVALVAPVNLSGAMVSRCSLHNTAIFRQHGLHVGDQVEVVRRGGVIPNLESSLGGGTEEVHLPLQCPSCGKPTLLAAPQLFVGGFRVNRAEARVPEALWRAREELSALWPRAAAEESTEEWEPRIERTAWMARKSSTERKAGSEVSGDPEGAPAAQAKEGGGERVGGGGDLKFCRAFSWSDLSRSEWAGVGALLELWRAAPRRSAPKPGCLVVAVGDPGQAPFSLLVNRLSALVEERGLDLRVFPTSIRWASATGQVGRRGVPAPLLPGLAGAASTSEPLPGWLVIPEGRGPELMAAGKSLAGIPAPGGRLFAFGADVTAWVVPDAAEVLPKERWDELVKRGQEFAWDKSDAELSDLAWLDFAMSLASRKPKDSSLPRLTLDRAYKSTLVGKGSLSDFVRRQRAYRLLAKLPQARSKNGRYGVLVSVDPALPDSLTPLVRCLEDGSGRGADVWVLPLEGSRYEENPAVGTEGEEGRGGEAFWDCFVRQTGAVQGEWELVRESDELEWEEVRRTAFGLSDDVLVCSEPLACRSATIGTLVYFAKTLGMEGFGPEVVAGLYDAGLLKRRDQFFTLTPASMMRLERMGELSTAKLLQQVEGAKRVSLALFLESLGIPDLAKQLSTKLAEQCGSLEQVQGLREEELLDKKRFAGVDFTTAVTVLGGLRRERESIEQLMRHMTLGSSTEGAAASQVEGGSSLAGKSVVFTGALTRFTRKEAQAMVRAAGGKTPDSVTKDLNILVVGQEEGGRVSSKRKEAEALNVKGGGPQILSEEQFLSLVGGAKASSSRDCPKQGNLL